METKNTLNNDIKMDQKRRSKDIHLLELSYTNRFVHCGIYQVHRANHQSDRRIMERIPNIT